MMLGFASLTPTYILATGCEWSSPHSITRPEGARPDPGFRRGDNSSGKRLDYLALISSTFRITTSFAGTFSSGPMVVVGTASIFFTTSMPLTTLPKTQ